MYGSNIYTARFIPICIANSTIWSQSNIIAMPMIRSIAILKIAL